MQNVCEYNIKYVYLYLLKPKSYENNKLFRTKKQPQELS